MKQSDTTPNSWRAESGAEDTRSPNASRGLMSQVNRGASGLRPSLAALLDQADVAYKVPLPFRLSFHLGLMLVALALLAGCGHKEGDGHDHAKEEAHGGHGHGAESPSGASFKAGKGVIVTEETRKILGLEVADVELRKLPNEIHFTVQVFGEKHRDLLNTQVHFRCELLAAGFLSTNAAAAITVGQPVHLVNETLFPRGGVVLKVQKSPVLGESEIVIGVFNATAEFKPGEFTPAHIHLPREEAVMVVPQTALLRTVEGTFVYAANGDAYLRTAVKVGSEADGWVEITDGLLAGDQVVTKHVQTLWLIELRATKGGGHSH